MLVFRHARTETTVGALLAGLNRAAAEGGGAGRLDLLLAAARLECALADFWSPSEDDWEGARQALAALAVAAAHWYLGDAPGKPSPWPGMADTVSSVLPPPDQRLSTSEPEGLRYYGLAPNSYAEAARQWQILQPRPTPAWVLGLRTMGSVLAPVVAATLALEQNQPGCNPFDQAGCDFSPRKAARPSTGAGYIYAGFARNAAPGAIQCRCSTLRPRGAPNAREIRASARLRGKLARWPGAFLVVDEGPGLSGSSLGGAVAFLIGLGVAEDRITLFPSWSPDPGRLTSAYAAHGWRRWSIFPAPALPPPASPEGGARDIGAGAWRRELGLHSTAPVWGQHERRKYLIGNGGTLAKFAGFGPYGRQTLARAERLAAAGWGPPLAPGAAGEFTGGVDGGWLYYRRLQTAPLRRGRRRAWAEFAGAYLAWVRSEFALGAAGPPTPALVEMLQVNAMRMPGTEIRWEPPTGVPVALDGRVLAPEWGETAAGWVKFDGTDHHDDPFFPGPADIAWDLAALGVEFGEAAGEAVVDAYCRRSGENRTRLQPRLRWHRLAYRAFRGAFCSFAATQVAEPDRARFRAAARRYRRLLSGSAAG